MKPARLFGARGGRYYNCGSAPNERTNEWPVGEGELRPGERTALAYSTYTYSYDVVQLVFEAILFFRLPKLSPDLKLYIYSRINLCVIWFI